MTERDTLKFQDHGQFYVVQSVILGLAGIQIQIQIIECGWSWLKSCPSPREINDETKTSNKDVHSLHYFLSSSSSLMQTKKSKTLTVKHTSHWLNTLDSIINKFSWKHKKNINQIITITENQRYWRSSCPKISDSTALHLPSSVHSKMASNKQTITTSKAGYRTI